MVRTRAADSRCYSAHPAARQLFTSSLRPQITGHCLCLPYCVAGDTDQDWHAGQRISVRGQLWRIVERTPFVDCDALRVRGAEPHNRTATRTILLPFDRPRQVHRSSAIAVMRPRRWLRTLYATAAQINPVGGLSAAASGEIALLPYQLEPALAMLRYGHTRAC